MDNIYGGQHARRFKNAARFRGEKEDVVFTCCFCCFQLRLYTIYMFYTV